MPKTKVRPSGMLAGRLPRTHTGSPAGIRGVAVLAVAGVLALAGCGGSGDAGPNAGASASPSSGGPISVKHSAGVTKLDDPAARVVALEWSYVEDLLALGVTPVGVADIEGYEKWVTAGPRLPGDVVDVGTRQEPSIEKVASLQPDLIITEKKRGGVNRGRLRDIAPTLVFDPYTKPQMATMKEIFTGIAAATGTTDEAGQVLARLDSKIAEVRKRLQDAGADGTEFALAQGYSSEGSPVLRLFTDQALPVQALERAGLANAWQGDPDRYGMTTVDVEALTKVEDASLLYVAQPGDDIFTGTLAGNQVWKGLQFVQEDRVHPLDPGTWFFGGPLSTMQVLEEAAKAMEA